MALPPNGSISLSEVNVELGKSATALISMNDSDARELAGKTSGTISMSDFYGKSSYPTIAVDIIMNADYHEYQNCGGIMKFLADGTIDVSFFGSYTDYTSGGARGTWTQTAGGGDLLELEVRVTPNNSSNVYSPQGFGAWYDISGTAYNDSFSWNYLNGGVTPTFTLEVRQKTNTSNIGSDTFGMGYE